MIKIKGRYVHITIVIDNPKNPTTMQVIVETYNDEPHIVFYRTKPITIETPEDFLKAQVASNLEAHAWIIGQKFYDNSQ